MLMGQLDDFGDTCPGAPALRGSRVQVVHLARKQKRPWSIDGAKPVSESHIEMSRKQLLDAEFNLGRQHLHTPASVVNVELLLAPGAGSLSNC